MKLRIQNRIPISAIQTLFREKFAGFLMLTKGSGAFNIVPVSPSAFEIGNPRQAHFQLIHLPPKTAKVLGKARLTLVALNAILPSLRAANPFRKVPAAARFSVAALLCLTGAPAMLAQTGFTSSTQVPNAGTSGTVFNQLACWSGVPPPGSAINCGIGASTNYIGVVVGNPGTSGAADIVTFGRPNAFLTPRRPPPATTL